MRHFLLSLLLFSTCLLPVKAEPLPLEAFASLPDVDHLTLSHGGRHLASTVRVELDEGAGRTVSILDLESGERSLPLSTDNETFVITRLVWASENKLLVAAMYPSQRYLGRWARRDVQETFLLTIDVETEEVQKTLSDRFLSRFDRQPVNKARITDTLPDDPEHILMTLDSQQGAPMVYKVNLENQRVTREEPPQNYVHSWVTDRQNRVRLAFRQEGTQVTIRERAADANSWRNLWEFEILTEESIHPMGFGKDPNQLYVRAYHEGFLAVFSVDLSDPELELTLVHAEPGRDLHGYLLYSHERETIVGLGRRGDGGYIFWDEDYQNFQKALDRAMPQTQNYLLSFSQDANRYLVLATSDTDSGTYLLGDREAGTLDAVAYRYQKLPPEEMHPREPYRYTSRDQLEIDGFLTLPAREEDEKLPTVLLPHGGPMVHEVEGFDYWAQFLASRGYAVLQMNFRGSSGRGLEFARAGLGGWGDEMQDDIQDGAISLIEAGIADPERICIVGASYGGYAALMGAVKTPNFYRCAFSFAGVSDLRELARMNRDFTRSNNMADLRLGSDHGEQRKASPVNHAEKIQIPVMLVHGDGDIRVPVGHSRDMADALEAAEQDFEYLELEGGNHFLSRDDHRIATFEALERFLAKHL